MIRILGKLCFFSAPVIVLIIGVTALLFSDVFGPLKPEKLDRATLIRVMHYRDFRDFSPEMLRQMTDRADAEFGRLATQKPIFSFSGIEKRIYAYFRQSERKPPNRFETNLLLMARCRYFQWMNDYEAFSERDRSVLMNGIVEDMRYWNTIYMDFLHAVELPIPSLEELIREFDKMVESFKTGASAEEIARIDSFKRRMHGALVAGEIGGAVKNLSENLSSKISGALGGFLSKPKKRPDPKNTNENSDRGKEPPVP